MPRKARITIPGAVHHIMSGGIERKPVFRDDNDRSFFLSILERSVLKSGYLVYAWALNEQSLPSCCANERLSFGCIHAIHKWSLCPILQKSERLSRLSVSGPV